MNKTAKIALISSLVIGICAIGYGVYSFMKSQVEKAMNYCYKIKSFRIIRLDKDKIIAEVDLLFRNRSLFDLSLLGYDINVYLNNTKIAIVKDNVSQIVNPDSLSVLTLKIDVIAKNVFSDIKKIALLGLYYISDKSKIIIKIEGVVSAQSSFLKVKNLPVNMEMNLKDILTDDPNKEQCTIF